MAADELTNLFKDNYSLDLPRPRMEQNLRKLAEMHLVRLHEREFVWCVNPEDDDQYEVQGRCCEGRVTLRPDLDENERAYHCPSCGRVLYPSEKIKCRSLRVSVVPDAICGYVRELLSERLGFSVVEERCGAYRVSRAGRTAEVCLMDFCEKKAMLDPLYPQEEAVAYIVANDGDFTHRIPRGAPVYRLADLIFRDCLGALKREIGGLMRPCGAENVRFPAIYAPTPITRWQVREASPPLITPSGARPGRRSILSVAGERYRELASRFGKELENLRWNVVEAYLVNGDEVGFSIRGGKMVIFGFRELGMVDNRSGRHAKRWDVLVKLCEKNGHCDSRMFGWEFDQLRKHAYELRDDLQALFRTKEEVFLECTSTHGVRSAFVAHPEVPSQLRMDLEEWKARQDLEKARALGSR